MLVSLKIAEAFWVCPGGSKNLVEPEEGGGEGEICSALVPYSLE